MTKLSLVIAVALFTVACTTPSKQQSMQDARQKLNEEKAKDDPCYEYRLSPEYDRCQAEQYRQAQRQAAKEKQRELMEQSRDSINDSLNRNTRELGL